MARQKIRLENINHDYVIPIAEYEKCYQIIKERDVSYAGQFFVGVKTTGVFCRPGCPARMPKFQNCDFFLSAEAAVNASFRPCLRCRPLSYLDQASDIIQTLIAAVEAKPEYRWKDADFDALSIHASTARRHFKNRFGMTFVQYARARRIGLAMNDIRQGKSVTHVQLESGYESGSGFRDAFSKIMGAAPVKSGNHIILKAHWLDTVLGPMLAIADDQFLYLLEFVNRRALEREVERLRKRLKAAIVPGSNQILKQITSETRDYFTGKLQTFRTPMKWLGSDFQKQVWQKLCDIPFGQTRSYAQLAQSIGKPTAVRAVGRANGCNQWSIIVPCHRLIGSDGSLTGYGGGLNRKQWLLEHEQKFS